MCFSIYLLFLTAQNQRKVNFSVHFPKMLQLKLEKSWCEDTSASRQKLDELGTNTILHLRCLTAPFRRW